MCLQSAEKTHAQYTNFQEISQVLIAQQLVWLRKEVLNLSGSSRNVFHVNSVGKGWVVFFLNRKHSLLQDWILNYPGMVKQQPQSSSNI